jgi:hypothetical protein
MRRNFFSPSQLHVLIGSLGSANLGSSLHVNVGLDVGDDVGADDGFPVGEIEGDKDGYSDKVGLDDGDVVGYSIEGKHLSQLFGQLVHM